MCNTKLLKKKIKFLSFEFINFDANVFVFKNKKMYIIVYVNDLLILNFDFDFISKIKKKFNNQFNITNLNSIKLYLKIKIIREKNLLFFRQNAYLKFFLKRFDMKKCSISNFFIMLKLDKILKSTKKS